MDLVGEAVRTVNNRGLRYLYKVVRFPRTLPMEATGPREAAGRRAWISSSTGRLSDQVGYASGGNDPSIEIWWPRILMRPPASVSSLWIRRGKESEAAILAKAA